MLFIDLINEIIPFTQSKLIFKNYFALMTILVSVLCTNFLQTFNKASASITLISIRKLASIFLMCGNQFLYQNILMSLTRANKCILCLILCTGSVLWLSQLNWGPPHFYTPKYVQEYRVLYSYTAYSTILYLRLLRMSRNRSSDQVNGCGTRELLCKGRAIR